MDTQPYDVILITYWRDIIQRLSINVDEVYFIKIWTICELTTRNSMELSTS
jgi:hypothetical protein